MREKLQSFLQSHNLLEEFISHSDLSFDRAVEYLGPERVLSHSFSWDKHHLGLDFWFELNEKWIRHIERIL